MILEQRRQNNGLETLFINSPGATSASVQIWFRAGSALEKKSEMGIAHFLEHMFFKGTKKRPGALIAHEVESFGGEINAFTSFDYTCYYINTPVNNISNTVEILMDMVSNPEFLNEEIIPERQVVFEEFRRSLDNPSQYNFKKLQESSFTKGYAHQILGTEKTIHNFSREQLVEFRNAYYNLENALLIVAGDIKSPKKLETIINQYQIPSGSKSSFPSFRLKDKPTLNTHKKDVNQTTLTFSIQAPDYSEPQSASEDLAINCLSYGEISPLYKMLVSETNIATGVSGSSMFFNNGGVHLFKIAFPTENLKKVLSTFEKTIKEVLKNGFTDDELQRIKNQYIASKVYERESIESYSFSLGHGFAQTGNIHSEDDFIKLIKNTTVNQINSSLADIFAKPIHLTLQQPQEEKSDAHDKTLKAFQEKLNKLGKKEKSTGFPYKVEKSKYDENTQVVTIKEGVKLVYRHNIMTPTFVFHTYLKGGLAYETEENNGIYYFLSRLLTYGYEKMPFEKLRSDLENKSAYLNGFSGKNAYGLTLHGLSDNFDSLLTHFFGTLINPQFPVKYLNNEKELIKRTLHNQKQDPVKQCFKKVNEMFFNKHPYSRSIIGTEKSSKKINRKLLQEVHAERLAKSEIVFTYCGDKDLNYIVDYLKDKISTFKPKKPKKLKKNQLKPIVGEKFQMDFNREQTHIFIGTPAYSIFDKNDLYLKMITTYLSGQSSDLFVEVRDRKGLCYAVQPIHHTALEAGYWGIYIGAGKDKVNDAIEAIMGIINNLKDNGLSKTEFERIKKMLDGQNQLNVQTNDDYANFYSIPTLHDLGLDYQHKTFDMMRSFEHKKFNNFLKDFFSVDWNIITVGPNS